MIYYVCKYTPIELFEGFGETCAVLEEMPENFEESDQIAHANLCGFGKSVIQAVLEGKADELVLVNCCDSMRRVYDIVKIQRNANSFTCWICLMTIMNVKRKNLPAQFVD